MSKEKPNAVVVGGGLAGIVTGLLLARQGKSVQLIESADECGGLLRTFKNEDGVPFDFGTHIPKEIGIPELDEILFGGLDFSKWQKLDRLRVGGFQHGEMYETSQFLDLRMLPEKERNAAVYELISEGGASDTQYLSAEEHSQNCFGPTITDELVDPLLMKLYGENAANLHPSAIGLVGYSRFIGFDRERSREVKQIPRLDSVFGFSTWDDGLSSQMNFYPKADGVQIWINFLLDQFTALGGKVSTGKPVTEIEVTDGVASSVNLGDTRYPVDELYWTGSPALLIKLMGAPFPKGLSAPGFRSSGLINLIFDKDFNTDLWFYYNHDPEMLSYRTTLYSSIRETNRREAPFNCTIEVLSDWDSINSDGLQHQLLAEMKEMGIIDDSHNVIYSKSFLSEKGFPIPTVGFTDNAVKLTDYCESLVSNVNLFGRATGKTHFMHHVLAEIWGVMK